MTATVDRVLTSIVTLKFAPAPPGVNNRTDESDVQELIKNAVGPSDKCGPNFAVTLDSNLPKLTPTTVMDTLPVAGPLPEIKPSIECRSKENKDETEACLLSTDSESTGSPTPDITLHIIAELDIHIDDSQELPVIFKLAE
jgi:hypothetical protein